MVQVSTTPPSERYPGRPPEGRVVVFAPTRAACETIELGVQLTGVETIINREHGGEIRELAAAGSGFGIVAGTGTGKTLAIRPIAEAVVGPDLRVGSSTASARPRPRRPTWNVVIVTTGIARRWLQDNLIDQNDVVVVDEIHQTSAELELCLALAKRAGCRFVWLSATVDPRSTGNTSAPPPSSRAPPSIRSGRPRCASPTRSTPAPSSATASCGTCARRSGA
jgi:hypothetical protein